MLKNPFEALHQLMKDKFDRDRVMIEFAHTQSDSMVTWLIGFAITGLTLILVNIEKIQSNLENALTPISVLLCLTICLGLIYRYLSPIIVVKQKGLQDFLSGIFADFDVTPIEADPEVDKASFDDILRKLKSDFDVDTPYPFQLTEAQKASELPKLVNHYKEWCKHSKRQFDIAVNHWAEVNETVYKIPKSKTVEKFKKVITNAPQTGYNFRLWTRLNGVLYLLYILSFMAAVIVICCCLTQS